MDTVIAVIKSQIGHVGTEDMINAAILMRNKYGMDMVAKLVTANMVYLSAEQTETLSTVLPISIVQLQVLHWRKKGYSNGNRHR